MIFPAYDLASLSFSVPRLSNETKNLAIFKKRDGPDIIRLYPLL